MSVEARPFAFDVALGELDAVTDVSARLTDLDWERATRLGDWTVAELLAHVTEIGWRQSEAFHRYRLGIAEPPGPAPVAPDPRTLPHYLRRVTAHLRGAAAEGFEEEPAVPLPFAALPASFASQVIAIEYGVHRHDLHHALGEGEELSSEVTKIILEVAPLYLLMIGQPAADGLGYRLSGDSFDFSVVWADSQWQLVETSDCVCVIGGSDQDMALFIMGRLPADDARLDRGGSEDHERFKTMFPGP